MSSRSNVARSTVTSYLTSNLIINFRGNLKTIQRWILKESGIESHNSN